MEEAINAKVEQKEENLDGYLPYEEFSRMLEKHFQPKLDQEMAKFNVDAAIVEPGNFRSDVMKNMHRRTTAIQSGKEQTRYAEEIARFASFAQADRSQHADPAPVAEAVLDFLTADKPKLRYMVSVSEAEVAYTLGRALQKVVELNDDQAFSQDLEQLTAKLEELFAKKN